MRATKLLIEIQKFLYWLCNEADMNNKEDRADIIEAAHQLDGKIDDFTTKKENEDE
jgi:hypothetical protein